MKYHKIDGKKCKQVIDDMIKTPTERKSQTIKDKLKKLMYTLPLTNRKESNTAQLTRLNLRKAE